MTRVYIGMSGGVDSSLAASLLVEQGYEVTGVYMKNWSQDLPGMKCPWAEDLADAKRVAVQLGIDFKVFDFEREYKQHVVDYMVDEYKAGRTPNPDIMCNQEVKFKLFLDAALADGADMIATGHYARVGHGEVVQEISGTVDSRHDSSSPDSLHPAGLGEGLRQSSDGQESGNASPGFVKVPDISWTTSVKLLQAVDTNKDQTYFLYRVTAEALSKTLFPLGEFTKPEVRKMAEERGLWTADKKESMGVCFVGSVSMRDFLSEYVTTHPGDVIDKQTSMVVGRHDGAIYYTLGQRHGLDIGGGLPYYVVGKDIDKNEVYVSTNLNDDAMWRDEIRLHSVHFISGKEQLGRYEARMRHRGQLVGGELQRDGDSYVLRLDNTERAITPGQSVVLYDGDCCIGGGIVV